MTVTQAANGDAALALHRAGRVVEAAAAYRALLVERPGDADLLGLLGVASEQMGDLAAAERLLRQGLAESHFAPVAYRNLNNLLGLLIESGREGEARDVASQIRLPDWPAGRQPDTVERDTVLSLLIGLKDLDQTEVAAEVARQFRGLLASDIDYALIAGELMYQAGQHEEASALLAADFGADEAQPNLHILRASLAHDRQDRETCLKSSAGFAAAMPTLLAEARPSQEFVLAVFNKAPIAINSFSDPYLLHYSGNFPSQLAQALADRFRFISIFPDSPTAMTAMREMPRPALGLNNIVNAEQLMANDTFRIVSEVEDNLGVKVINHPKLAVGATRQKNSERFANHPEIIFPRISRYFSSRDLRGLLIDDIEGRYTYPLILRTVFQQMGKGTWLINDRKELNETLDLLNENQFYIIEYISSRHENGLSRSIRAAFVDGHPIIIRADYSDNWNVRARYESVRQAFYRDHPDILAYANHIVMEPEKELGKTALEKLHKVAELMPLEIFGMDFDITEDGKLLIFEANATMNLLSTSPEGFHYPKEVEDRLVGYLCDYFCRTATGR
ncbi:hypothetical protein LMIY3S_05775 [Labrys miyagiensis]